MGLPLRADSIGTDEEKNVWTLSGGILSKGDWQFSAEWQTSEILRINGWKSGEGVLDWDGIVLRMGDKTISDLGVQIGFCALQSAPITEFYCNKMEDMGTWGFKGNSNICAVRASGLRLTALNGNCFEGCTSLTNVVFDFPNMRTVSDSAFSDCRNMKADVMDILNPGVTKVGASVFLCSGNDRIAGLTGTLVLTNVAAIGGNAFKGAGISGIYLAGPCSKISDSAFFWCSNLKTATFDLAPDACVETENTFGAIWGATPLKDIHFLRKPFDAASMTNLLWTSSYNMHPLTAANALVIYVSRVQWPKVEREACEWWLPATAETLTEDELAAKPHGCLGIAEVSFNWWNFEKKPRRAWIVHEPSPYDKGGFYIRIR